MCAVDRALQVLPEILNPVGVNLATDIFSGRVADGFMVISCLGEVIVRPQVVGEDLRSLGDVGFDDGLKDFLTILLDDLRHHLTATLKHSHDYGLAVASAILRAPLLSANIGFVHLHNALKRPFTIHIGDVLADLMPHAPCRFVRDAELPLQFKGRDAMPGCGEKVDGVEPQLQGRPAILKGRFNCGVEVMAAPLAGIGAFGLNSVPVGLTLAFRALIALTKAGLKKVCQTCFVRGEKGEKLTDRNGWFLFHGPNLDHFLTYVKGIIP